jgi:BASS family bile acid:Na+ symporter
MAPFITPFYMKFLGGEFIAVDYLQMMWDITKVVIIPIVAGLIFHHLFHHRFKLLEKIMPLFSMAGIAFILIIIVARGRDNLLEVGLLLVAAVFIHNMFGYFLGYFTARLLRMPEQDCRTIALEVGMQNAGLASSIAADTLGKASTIGLAPAIFGSMMNITGSSLALWWRSKPIKDE